MDVSFFAVWLAVKSTKMEDGNYSNSGTPTSLSWGPTSFDILIYIVMRKYPTDIFKKIMTNEDFST